MEIQIAEPHGFCTGVARAIQIAETVLAATPGETLYCLHELVHNQHVVERLHQLGMVFVQQLADVPCGAQILFSAHGVSPAVRREACERKLRVIDATCPFVDKVHKEVIRFAKAGLPVICVGHKGHDEVVGVTGEAPDMTWVVESPEEVASLSWPADVPIAVVSQTTISAESFDRILRALHERYPNLQQPARTDICYATRDRQQAVQQLAPQVDLLLVLGSQNSSNSKRLVETARACGTPAELIGAVEDLRTLDLSQVKRLGITSGASTPESFLENVLENLPTHSTIAVPLEEKPL